MEHLIIARLLADDASAATETAVDSTNLVMVLFKVAIAVYLLVAAVRGKGKLIDNEYPKCKPAVYRLIMRLISTLAALIILANSAFEFLAGSSYGAALPFTAAQYATINTVLWAVGLVALLALIVVNIVLTDRKAMEAARKSQEQARQHSSKGNDPLHAAFVFDEEEVKAGEFVRKDEQESQGQSK